MTKQFAELNAENYVDQVITIDESCGLDEHGEYKEILVIGELKQLFGANTKWIESSISGEFRYRAASPGYYYDEDSDAFISPKIFASFTLDDTTLEWIPPLPMPELPETDDDDDFIYTYVWNEELHQEDSIQGWVLIPVGLKEESQES